MTLADLQRKRSVVITATLVLTAAIAVVDRQVHARVPLGLLYLLPMGAISTLLRRWQVIVAALLYTVVAETSDAFAWNAYDGIVRDLLSFIAYAAEGLYICEALRRHKAEAQHLASLTHEIEARRDAEEQLSLLVDSTALAILTTDDAGRIIRANASAAKLFAAGDEEGSLHRLNISELLPALSYVMAKRSSRRELRTLMQCQGYRPGGEPFLADVWLSLYSTSKGDRTTAIVVDASDALRDREESALEQMLHSSRLAVGAVSHEFRNITAALSLVQRNMLTHHPDLGTSPDFDSLRQLTGTLERMSSVELAHSKRSAVKLNLQLSLEEFRILAQSALREKGIHFLWSVPSDLPPVWADQQGILQVLLNLLRNSETALENTAEPAFSVEILQTTPTLQICLADNGPGIASADSLFHPFDQSGTSAGFGLYLSRALMNSFRGDLRYLPGIPGARFVMELQVYA